MVVTHHCGKRSNGDLMPQLSHSRLLFAAKHYGMARRLAIRAALALGHGIRAVAFVVAALVDRSKLDRARPEWAALRVTIGQTGPPLGRNSSLYPNDVVTDA
jgi:hypothetical protein